MSRKNSDSSFDAPWAVKNRELVKSGLRAPREKILHDILKRLIVPDRVVDGMCGVGNLTRVLDEVFPFTPLVAIDQDQRCIVETVLVCPRVVAIAMDVTDFTFMPGDGVVLDFNILTLLTAQREYADFFRYLGSCKPEWVLVGDCARGKIHLNYKSYGCEATYISYVEAWDRWVKPFGLAAPRAFETGNANWILLETRR